MKLTNNAKRSIAVPFVGRHVILKSGESTPVTIEDFEVIQRSRAASGWFKSGLITIDRGNESESSSEPEAEPKSEPQTDGSPEAVHQGSGWYRVIVGGIDVGQKAMRKDEAEALLAEYQ